MKIYTEELELAFQKIILKLRDNDIDCIELKQDDYWFLSRKDSYKMEFKVEDELVGSFVDDWQNLKRVIENKQITTFLDFDRIAAILLAIGEELNPEE